MYKLIFIGLVSFFLIACNNEKNTYSGYIDTDLVYLSSDFAGRLVNLPVIKGQLVKINQFLFRLEQTSELYDESMGKETQNELLAQRQQALASLNYAEINYKRIQVMKRSNSASQGDLDLAKRDLDQAKQKMTETDAKILSNQVDIKNRQWRIRQKENSAPAEGIIFDTYYKPGEFVGPGSPVLSLITKEYIKVVFFVPETELSQIRINEKIKIMTAENANFAQGHIFYVSNIAEFTAPILYSQKERSRLVFRVEAKIDSPDLEKLHLGQPVTLDLSK